MYWKMVGDPKVRRGETTTAPYHAESKTPALQ